MTAGKQADAVIWAHDEAGRKTGKDERAASGIAGVVRAQQTRLAVASQQESICDLGCGDHVAANAGGCGGGAVSGISETLSDAAVTGVGAGAGCAGDVERAGILPACSDAAQGGAVCERESARESAGDGGGVARAAG